MAWMEINFCGKLLKRRDWENFG